MLPSPLTVSCRCMIALILQCIHSTLSCTHKPTQLPTHQKWNTNRSVLSLLFQCWAPITWYLVSFANSQTSHLRSWGRRAHICTLMAKEREKKKTPRGPLCYGPHHTDPFSQIKKYHDLFPIHPAKWNIILWPGDSRYLFVINAFSVTQLMGNYVSWQIYPVHHYVY